MPLPENMTSEEYTSKIQFKGMTKKELQDWIHTAQKTIVKANRLLMIAHTVIEEKSA